MARFIKKIATNIAWYRFLRLRHRDFLTKADTIRLRYIAGLSLFLFIAVSGFVSRSGAMHAEIRGISVAHATGHPERDSEPLSAAYNDAFHASHGDFSEARLIGASMPMITPPRPTQRRLKVAAGDTVAGLLQRAGISSAESYKAVEAMKKHHDPRKIMPGTNVTVRFGPPSDGAVRFASMTVDITPVQTVTVSKKEGVFQSAFLEKKLVTRPQAYAARIETSLYGSAARAGIPAPVIAEAIRAYSWSVDFQRQIRSGDKIELLYDLYETEDGAFVKYGKIRYARLSVGGADLPIYRYQMNNGDIDYFDPEGRSIRKALMKTPVDGARLSSGYGMRKHPVLGYNKMHKGVDFAGPRGTPIYAAGDGVIEHYGRYGAYGNYVRIRHNSALKTAYAHLSKYAKGLAVGKRVKQGDVIGYIGATGRVTGAHLHYEVIENGHQVNPNKIDLPTGEILTGNDLKNFKAHKGILEQHYASYVGGIKFAQNTHGPAQKNTVN